MLFNSFEFIFGFLPVALMVFFLLGRMNRKLAAAWLALASLLFYGYWSPKYVPLLLAAVSFNYFCGRAIAKRAGTKSGRTLLTASIVADLVLLGFYKYADFFLSSVNGIAHTHLQLLRIVLPIGISFFTFTQIAFLVDCYKRVAREYSFSHYLLFVSYFPHLIAGPILHHTEIMPQFASVTPYRPSARLFAIGLTVLTIGLAKKILIADNFADYAIPVFTAAHDGVPIRLVAAWVGSIAYTFQLYFDFSGYTDMAIGLSKLFGVDLPINFFSPYKSTNIIEFWRRWHMTLSRFLRDYLYFPLGGNRKGRLRRCVNLMITMLLGGLWHGANWTFVVWGGLHGIYLLINHGWQSVRPPSNPPALLGKFFSSAMTFLAVVVGWVFFRAEDFRTATNILRGMIGFNGIAMQNQSGGLWAALTHLIPQLSITSEGALDNIATPGRLEIEALLLIGALVVWTMPNTQQIAERLEAVFSSSDVPFFYRRAVPALAGLLLALALLQMEKVSEFLYFQF
ncbi:MAG TPA: MBOAT family protein [Steroidobacteraceae bacterium]|nr:MBOAT family protein [Steroidobacteraceae bacterium]